MTKKVLLIDDDKNIIATLKDVFKANGYEDISWSNDGAEGLILCAKQKYDLIYVDHHMPYLTGLEVLREIRSGIANKDTPIIMMSSDLPNVIDESKETLDKSIFLPKPIELARFQRYINLLNQK